MKKEEIIKKEYLKPNLQIEEITLNDVMFLSKTQEILGLDDWDITL